MSTVSSYILRQISKPLAVAIIIALMVLLVERMLRLLDLVFDSRGSIFALLRMLAYLVPHYMALALPVAFFLGMLLAFSNLQQRSELDAFGAAGIGLQRLIRPALMLAIFLGGLSAFSFGVVQPHARYTYRAMVHDVSETSVNAYLQERVFMEAGQATFMAEEINRGGRSFSRIFIYQEGEDGRSSVTTARRGTLSGSLDGVENNLLLEEGVRLRSDIPGSGATDENGKTDTLNFDQFQMPIDLGKQKLFRLRGIDERELTLKELWQYRNRPPRKSHHGGDAGRIQ